MVEKIGKQLKQIRESRGISLEEISQKTRIRLGYLDAIETGDVDALPSPAQTRGFLRLYASTLGVELDALEVEGYHLTESRKEEEIAAGEDILPIIPSAEDQPAAPPIDSSPDPEAPLEAISKDEPEQQVPRQDVIAPEEETAQDSRQIFTEIGTTLRERRELLSLSLRDIEEMLHIREEYIKDLEAGAFDHLPSPVQGKGMLANYTEFLNLDTDAILLAFADGLQIQRLEKQQTPSTKKKEAKELSLAGLRLRNFFSLDLLVILVLFISFAVFVIWGVNRILENEPSNSLSTDIPEMADVLLATGSPTPRETLSPDAVVQQDGEEPNTEEETPIFTSIPSNYPINIVITPRQRVWVQITSDDELVFEGRLLPGNAYNFTGQEAVEILTGNAGALQIYFNDQDIGAPGVAGQVVNLIFTDTGLILPTPTTTPIYTNTPDVTPILTVTPTPSGTSPEPNE